MTGELLKMSNDITELQDLIAKWADVVHPNRTPVQALTKMVMQEIPELIRPSKKGEFDALEFADVAILLFDAARLCNIDMGQAIREKMAINTERDWEIDPETGLMQHVEKPNETKPC